MVGCGDGGVEFPEDEHPTDSGTRASDFPDIGSFFEG